MSLEGLPGSELLPGEAPIAQYRNGQLTLTNRRVVYQGRGRARNDSLSIALEEVSAAGLMRGYRVLWYRFAIPAAPLLGGFWMFMLSGSDGYILVGALLALPALPLPFLGRGRFIRIAAPGHRLKVHVRHSQRIAAQTFVAELIKARFTRPPPAPVADVPTTQAFGR